MRLFQRLLEWSIVCVATWLAIVVYNGEFAETLEKAQRLFYSSGSELIISGVHEEIISEDPSKIQSSELEASGKQLLRPNPVQADSSEASDSNSTWVKEVNEHLRKVHEFVRPMEEEALRKQRTRKWFHTTIDLSDPKLLLYWPKNPADYCTGESHFSTAFSCLAAEASYLKRVFVLKSTVCFTPDHNNGSFGVMPIEAYYDLYSMRRYLTWIFEDDLVQALKASPFKALVSEQVFGPDARTRELKKSEAKIVVRDFSESGWSYGFDVCGHPHTPLKIKSALQPNKELQKIIDSICATMDWDFDAVHVRRGDKLDPKRWPNLDRDTRPFALMSTLRKRLIPGRHLYISTDEQKKGFFDPVRSAFKVHKLDDYSKLWGRGSSWFNWSKAMFGGTPVFDNRMRVIVDYKVFQMAKTKLRTFNDLTEDPKEGLNQDWNLSTWDLSMKEGRSKM